MHEQQPPFQVGTKTPPGTRLFLVWLVPAAALTQAVITDLPGCTQAPSRRAAELKSSRWVTERGSSPGVLSPSFLYGSMGQISTAALPVRGGLLGFVNVAGTFPVPLGAGGCLSCASGDVKGAAGLREMVAVLSI